MEKEQYDKEIQKSYDNEVKKGNINMLNESYGFRIGSDCAHGIMNVKLVNAAVIIDDYLNAGSKEERQKVSEKAKEFYKDFTGCEYKNRNERV